MDSQRNIQVIITTGGTGFTGRDSTPEALEPLFDKTIDGFSELFRQISFKEIGSSTIQSRAIAGIANGTLVFSPGSSNAVEATPATNTEKPTRHRFQALQLRRTDSTL